MTEKDAVKCRNFACNNWYVLRVDAVIDPGFINHLSAKLKLTPKHNGGKD
jgi:tetraacyldisaccharide 4'-kinase